MYRSARPAYARLHLQGHGAGECATRALGRGSPDTPPLSASRSGIRAQSRAPATRCADRVRRRRREGPLGLADSRQLAHPSNGEPAQPQRACAAHSSRRQTESSCGDHTRTDSPSADSFDASQPAGLHGENMLWKITRCEFRTVAIVHLQPRWSIPSGSELHEGSGGRLISSWMRGQGNLGA